MKLNLKIVIIFFLLISCSKKGLELSVFQIDQSKITYEILLDEGYVQSSVDVLMLEKNNADTTVVFEFGYEPTTLHSKMWRFNVSEDYKKDLKALFNKNDIFLMVPNNYNEIQEGDFFCLKGHNSNIVYFGVLNSVDDYIEVTIVYYYPLTSYDS